MSLNKDQLRASLPDFGVNIVLAGAGAGKTKTLVEKVVNIINHTHIKPENILIMTFSRKAAEEIKSRVVLNAGDSADKITSGTFHSFCLYLIRQYKERFLEISGFSKFPEVINEDDGDIILNEIIIENKEKLHGLPFNIVYGFIKSRRFLKHGITAKLESTGLLKIIDEMINKYSEVKRKKLFIDFDDMMFYAAAILESTSIIKNEVHDKFRYIFVDEYQDTSGENFMLLKQLLPEKPNLFAVGDDFQSIYGFRGSCLDYIVKPEKYFNKPGKHILRVNYRSKKEIVTIAGRFIKKNKNRSSKKLISHKGPGGLIKEKFVADFEEEVFYLKELLDTLESRDIAILYRNNFQGLFIRKMLETDDSRVKFMTIHASKGLEFDTVILAGLSDKIIPDRSSDIEEERRLIYVAITRARENLYLIFHMKGGNEYPYFAKELGYSD
jgi:DNA helicase-2/ATP-dependent DNA helicase PcrA